MMREDLICLDDITHWAPVNSCERLRMLRLDKIHPVVSGNKWYKLKHNIAAAKACGKDTILTFGGGYSNHLVAAAAAARDAGLRAIGVVRGIYEKPSPTLLECASLGMELRFHTKAEYARLQAGNELAKRIPQSFIIPEGGANEAGIRGAEDISALIPQDARTVCVAVGTGTTLTGLHRALPAGVRLFGYCAAKECDKAWSLIQEMDATKSARVRMFYSAVPFGKSSPQLIHFTRSFFAQTGIPLDVVYTAKMMALIWEQLREGGFKNEHVVCIHTGGLQGNPTGIFHLPTFSPYLAAP